MEAAGNVAAVAGRETRQRKGKQFFFEKNQKTFVFMARAAGESRASPFNARDEYVEGRKELLF
jgi:hypothetical protein